MNLPPRDYWRAAQSCVRSLEREPVSSSREANRAAWAATRRFCSLPAVRSSSMHFRFSARPVFRPRSPESPIRGRSTARERRARPRFAPIVEDASRASGRWPASVPHWLLSHALRCLSACRSASAAIVAYHVFASSRRNHGRAVTVPSLNGFTQTFPAVLNRSFSPYSNRLDSGQRGCFSAFQAAADRMGQSMSSVAVELLVQSGQIAHPLGLAAVHWFLNVNTPQDLHRAEAVIARVMRA